MLSKLLKYELKATARILLPVYVVLLVFAAVHRTVSALSVDQWQASQVISMTIYVMIFVGMFVMTLIVLIQRFYKNLLSDEGYLMFTLPTRAWKHIICKLLISMMWTAVSGVVALISICIITLGNYLNAESIRIMLDEIKGFFHGATILFILESIILCIISMASSVLIIYASIALGHLLNKHRILASIGAFIVLNTASQILFMIVGYMGSHVPVPGITWNIDGFQVISPFVHLAMWFMIIFFGLLSAGYYVLTNYILSRRLNLE